ncbi:ABC transporter substrate-binding protein [Roseicella aquatilis]|uniref:ABC transporter substrate-binding protein n=1 Tax=Roseicella aquatilis TaxID=2527868 RepID=A0A4R4DLK0_9PROT|nr:ABC transporter substrate-binding protein [Roseicella aquatilis]TCZ60897.1 ABC transporter substrate-binding protein [Roseicella aquatilis]
MHFNRRGLLAATTLATVQAGRPARAQPARGTTIRLGALTDMSGPYRDIEGPTGTACVRQAMAEFTAANPEVTVELVVADHQNKPDVASAIVREWFDRGGVDAICQVGNTAVALAANTVAKEKDKVHLNSGALSSVLTGAQCSPNLVHGPLDTWAMSHATATAIVRDGGDSWFFIAADYAYGHALRDDAAKFVQAAGGKVLGAVAHPFPGTTDFASFLLQAQASRAKVVALANSGTDLINCLKQAREFGITRRGTRLAGLGAFTTDVAAVGLPVAQGLLLAESFYWDLNERTRAFQARLKARLAAGVVPNTLQAGAYALVRHYLATAKAMGVAEARQSGQKTVAAMKARPMDDDAFGAGVIREDGQMIVPVHLFQAKAPEESRGPDDLLRLVATIPAAEAFRPLAEGGCPMIRS